MNEERKVVENVGGWMDLKRRQRELDSVGL
jgi:hypothetical protein